MRKILFLTFVSIITIIKSIDSHKDLIQNFSIKKIENYCVCDEFDCNAINISLCHENNGQIFKKSNEDCICCDYCLIKKGQNQNCVQHKDSNFLIECLPLLKCDPKLGYICSSKNPKNAQKLEIMEKLKKWFYYPFFEKNFKENEINDEKESVKSLKRHNRMAVPDDDDDDDSEPIVGCKVDTSKRDHFSDIPIYQSKHQRLKNKIYEDNGSDRTVDENGNAVDFNKRKKRGIRITTFWRVKIVDKLDPEFSTTRKLFQYMPSFEWQLIQLNGNFKFERIPEIRDKNFLRQRLRNVMIKDKALIIEQQQEDKKECEPISEDQPVQPIYTKPIINKKNICYIKSLITIPLTNCSDITNNSEPTNSRVRIEFIYSEIFKNWFNLQLLNAKQYVTPQPKQMEAINESECVNATDGDKIVFVQEVKTISSIRKDIPRKREELEKLESDFEDSTEITAITKSNGKQRIQTIEPKIESQSYSKESSETTKELEPETTTELSRETTRELEPKTTTELSQETTRELDVETTELELDSTTELGLETTQMKKIIKIMENKKEELATQSITPIIIHNKYKVLKVRGKKRLQIDFSSIITPELTSMTTITTEKKYRVIKIKGKKKKSFEEIDIITTAQTTTTSIIKPETTTTTMITTSKKYKVVRVKGIKKQRFEEQLKKIQMETITTTLEPEPIVMSAQKKYVRIKGIRSQEFSSQKDNKSKYLNHINEKRNSDTTFQLQKGSHQNIAKYLNKSNKSEISANYGISESDSQSNDKMKKYIIKNRKIFRISNGSHEELVENGGQEWNSSYGNLINDLSNKSNDENSSMKIIQKIIIKEKRFKDSKDSMIGEIIKNSTLKSRDSGAEYKGSRLNPSVIIIKNGKQFANFINPNKDFNSFDEENTFNKTAFGLNINSIPESAESKRQLIENSRNKSNLNKESEMKWIIRKGKKILISGDSDVSEDNEEENVNVNDESELGKIMGLKITRKIINKVNIINGSDSSNGQISIIKPDQVLTESTQDNSDLSKESENKFIIRKGKKILISGDSDVSEDNEEENVNVNDESELGKIMGLKITRKIINKVNIINGSDSSNGEISIIKPDQVLTESTQDNSDLSKESENKFIIRKGKKILISGDSDVSEDNEGENVNVNVNDESESSKITGLKFTRKIIKKVNIINGSDSSSGEISIIKPEEYKLSITTFTTQEPELIELDLETHTITTTQESDSTSSTETDIEYTPLEREKTRDMPHFKTSGVFRGKVQSERTESKINTNSKSVKATDNKGLNSKSKSFIRRVAKKGKAVYKLGRALVKESVYGLDVKTQLGLKKFGS